MMGCACGGVRGRGPLRPVRRSARPRRCASPGGDRLRPALVAALGISSEAPRHWPRDDADAGHEQPSELTTDGREELRRLRHEVETLQQGRALVRKALSGQLSGRAGGGVCATRRMKEQASAPSDKRHRFPPAISGHAVWRSCRFARSDRDVEALLAERGVIVTYETVRRWCRTFGQTDANGLRHRRARPGDTWHLDGVFVSINGVQHYLWRAVDQDGNALAILVQPRRDKRAAVRFLRKLLKGLASVPRVAIMDKRASYGAALRKILPSVEHRRHKGLNNRAEHAHRPTRERERRMRRFTGPGHAQRFLAASGPLVAHCRPRRHRLTAAYRQTSTGRFATWRAVTGTPALA